MRCGGIDTYARTSRGEPSELSRHRGVECGDALLLCGKGGDRTVAVLREGGTRGRNSVPRSIEYCECGEGLGDDSRAAGTTGSRAAVSRRHEHRWHDATVSRTAFRAGSSRGSAGYGGFDPVCHERWHSGAGTVLVWRCQLGAASSEDVEKSGISRRASVWRAARVCASADRSERYVRGDFVDAGKTKIREQGLGNRDSPTRFSTSCPEISYDMFHTVASVASCLQQLIFQIPAMQNPVNTRPTPDFLFPDP